MMKMDTRQKANIAQAVENIGRLWKKRKARHSEGYEQQKADLGNIAEGYGQNVEEQKAGHGK